MTLEQALLGIELLSQFGRAAVLLILIWCDCWFALYVWECWLERE